ncbi:histidine--tRNA ligase [Micrococcoides hystricis]|uniref:Histidine--tRNA ligase n=1 Tax=Micrococcoides hystricis TaxID=1572761 RepID=A0ABV6P7I5_9MICC
MARKSSLSGFTELLPAERVIENHILEVLAKTFELHGFANIETRAVEPVEQLLRKGEIDKEIYVISRIHEEASEAAAKSRQLALHFDLTVPFARYVVENAGYLAFPFRRYQIQKVWRGERPQDGRSREFTQADIDVVGDGTLPFVYDVELAVVMAEALSKLPIGDFKLRINNRKLTEGFYTGLGLTDTAAVLREIDKLEKIGADAVRENLIEHAGASAEQADKALALAQIRSEDTSFVDEVRALGVSGDQLEEGLSELSAVIAAVNEQAPGRGVADLSIARGLDYYTGTVYETVLVGHEDLGSICSGGRYDALATKGKKNYPGVGLSIGVTRLVSRLLGQELVSASRPVPSVVYITLATDEDWPAAQKIAQQLRSRGIACEVAASAEKFGKQIRYADRRSIPYVWFTHSDGTHEVKDLRSGEQSPADALTWCPAEEDLRPFISLAENS